MANRILSVLLLLSIGPRVACLGSAVTSFSLPFEARPADPVRQASFAQWPSSSSVWFAPVSVPERVAPTGPSVQRPVGPLPKTKRRRR